MARATIRGRVPGPVHTGPGTLASGVGRTVLRAAVPCSVSRLRGGRAALRGPLRTAWSGRWGQDCAPEQAGQVGMPAGRAGQTATALWRSSR